MLTNLSRKSWFFPFVICKTDMEQANRIDRFYLSSRLKARLSQFMVARSVLIEAPPGYGKTTLIQQLMQQYAGQDTVLVRHVSIEETPQAGWRRFCRRVESLDGQTGRALLASGPPKDDTAGEIADLLREIAPVSPSWPVLDDFHHLAPLAPVSVWRSFLEHGSDLLKLVILTRPLEESIMPDEKSGHFRLGVEDLRLTEQESREYFAQAGFVLTREQAEGLYQKTEGWMISLSLHLRHWNEKGDFAPASGIEGLLRDVLWNRLDDDARNFLLWMSPFDHASHSQILAAIDARVSVAGVMNALRQNHLIRFDAASGIFYPHSTFLEFIRARFAELPKVEQESILKAAAKWCAANGEREAALEIYYRLGAFDKFLSLDLSFLRGMENSRLPHKLDVSHLETLRVVVANSPKELRVRYPLSFIQLIFEFFGQGSYGEFATLRALMAELVETEIPEEKRDYLRGELTLLEAFTHYNNIAEMGERIIRASKLTGGKTAIVGPDNTWLIGNISVVFTLHSEVGSLAREVDDMKKYFPSYISLTNGNGSGATELMEAEAYLLQGDTAMAAILGHRARQAAALHDQASILVSVEFLFGRLAVLHGDAAAFAAVLKNMESIVESYPRSSSRFARDMGHSFLMSLLDRPDAMTEWLKQGSSESFSRRLFSQAVPFANVCRARFLLLDRQPQVYLDESETAASLARVHRFVPAQIYGHIHNSAAWLMRGNAEAAEKSLREALDMALPDRLLLPFAENHSLIRQPLEALFSGSDPVYPDAGHLASIMTLADQMDVGRQVIVKKLHVPADHFGLSWREYEIACLAAGGLSSADISRRLLISLNTVKTHLKAVYAKTGSTSRIELQKILEL